MLSKSIIEALSEQANKEIYSGYFYLGMSDYAASKGLAGFANWFYAQWKEEIAHAKVIFNYIHKNGQRAGLKAIDNPPQDFTSGQDLFEKTLAHEKKVTGLINKLVELAADEKDEKTVEFLQWFVKEQREEEATPAGILDEIKKAGEKGLAEVDKKLSARK